MKLLIALLLATPFAASATEQVQFTIRVGLTMCEMKDAETPTKCTFDHSSQDETFKLDLANQGGGTDFVVDDASVLKTYTLLRPDTNEPVEVLLSVHMSRWVIEGKLSYNIEGSLSPVNGKRADKRESFASVLDIKAFDDIQVNGIGETKSASDGIAREAAPWLFVSKVSYLP